MERIAGAGVSEAYKNRMSTAAKSKLLFGKHLRELFPEDAITTEHLFADGRKWRFDLAIPAKLLAFEIEGGIFMQGAHTRGKHYLSDCEKYNTALLDGWKVFRFSTQQVMEGQALAWLKENL